jgi:hypothetical protein
MWHLKTRLGVFWVVPISSSEKKFLLGVNDEELGIYTDIEQAAKDVHDQATGFLRWDVQPIARAPERIAEWAQGEPKSWDKN